MDSHFKEISKKLDEKNDKYERIYKTNRDITMKSKRVIFALQRIPGLSNDERKKILASSSSDLLDIEQTLMKYIAMELENGDSLEFLNAYTGGIQEYIEALTFHNFLLTETILSHNDVQEKLTFKRTNDTTSDSCTICVIIPPKEYMLGLADLTGELMRFCIKSISVGDFAVCYKISEVLKKMKAGYLSLGIRHPRELYHKIGVFNSSLAKVEDACYSLELRKSELPPEMLAEEVSMSENEYVPTYI